MSKTKDYYWTEVENAVDEQINTIKTGASSVGDAIKQLADKNYAFCLLGYDEFESSIEEFLEEYIYTCLDEEGVMYGEDGSVTIH